MSERTLLDKVWKDHAIRQLPGGEEQIFVDLQYIHEVTSSPAFRELIRREIPVRYPERHIAMIDHVAPTDFERASGTEEDRELAKALVDHCERFGVRCFDINSPNQGIVHIKGPEMGLTQPGLTLVCGDSHTSTHGAFGAIAWGIGTSQVAQVLATQCLPMTKPKVRRIVVNGDLREGVTAKDVILHVIHLLGVAGGKGYAYEYGGSVIESFSMDERMTVCNMTIEGGARFGYINPDQVTLDYLRHRYFVSLGHEDRWLSYASDMDAVYDHVVEIKAADIEMTVTWGTNPGESIPLSGTIPENADPESLAYMGFAAGDQMLGKAIDVAFIGSCTNGRLSDLRRAAQVVRGRQVADGVKAIVVPGSELVRAQAEQEGIDKIFTSAGFEWRRAGCSMCLAMNEDKLQGNQLCISSSNRNFRGRQGSKTGRTILASPELAAAAAISGVITDYLPYLKEVA